MRSPGGEAGSSDGSVGAPVGSVLFVGQTYYHAWYLSRALRERGWRADVLDTDHGAVAAPHDYTHGTDFRFIHGRQVPLQLGFYERALDTYEIFHFSKAHGFHWGPSLSSLFSVRGEAGDVRLLKGLGKKLVYSNNACLDGVAQSSFASWGDRAVCDDCVFRDQPEVCSDELNLAWGKLRNELADYQITYGGNRVDYNDDPSVFEVPEFYCVDDEVWTPDLEVPPQHRLPHAETTVKIYHAVGDYGPRTTRDGRNLKSTQVWLPLVESLKREGGDVDLVFVTGRPNWEVRYLQAQCDIVVDGLTFGIYGSNVLEAMMLGKPAVCYLRPEWLDQMREQIPEYVDELPVVSATPSTAEAVLRELIENPEKRDEIGRRSREFALKWHSPAAGARRLEQIYLGLLGRAATPL